MVSGKGIDAISRSRISGVGTLTLSSSARFSRYDSIAVKKNARSRISGPPNEPPPWVHSDSGFSRRKKGLETSSVPS